MFFEFWERFFTSLFWLFGLDGWKGDSLDRTNYRTWFSRKIPDLKKNLFFSLCIKHAPINVLEKREILVESLAEVLFEIARKYEPPSLDKHLTLLTIDA